MKPRMVGLQQGAVDMARVIRSLAKCHHSLVHQIITPNGVVCSECEREIKTMRSKFIDAMLIFGREKI